MIDVHDNLGDTRYDTRIWLSLLRKMHSYLSRLCPSLLSFSLSRVPLWSLPRTWALCLLVSVFQMGLQSPVVVLVEVLDIEPPAAAAGVVAAAERQVARGAEEVEEEEEHRRRRRLGALLLKSQETQVHKSAAAWSMYVL